MNTSSHEPWPAPTAEGPVQASVRLPGSKSITNRALILAALADGPSTLRRPLVARDSALMVGALRTLGTEVTDAADAWTITPSSPVRGGGHVDCGLAGTVMRFVPPVAALAEGPVSFDGDPYARKRPMGTVVDALRTLGAEIDDDGRGALPFVIRGTGGLAGGAVTIDASASSQFVSSLLLAGARYDKGVTIHHDGKPIPSVPHVEMTVGMLRAAGVEVDDGTANTWRIEPGPIAALDLDIEPDLSNAAPFLAAALVTGGEVHIPGWPQHTTQPGAELRDLLTRMGAEATLDGTGLTVRGTGTVHGLDADLHDVSELTPVLAALAALADGPSHLRGVGHIRGHETDRLAALATELNALGGEVTETEDGLTIQPRPLRSGVFHTYADHRMAQAGAVIGLAGPGIEVENIATTAKTMPEFAELWARMVTAERAA